MPIPRATPQRRQGPIPEPPALTPKIQPQPAPEPSTGNVLSGVGDLMISSLPNLASGADVYARQFYRGSKVPFRRYLPIVRQ